MLLISVPILAAHCFAHTVKAVLFAVILSGGFFPVPSPKNSKAQNLRILLHLRIWAIFVSEASRDSLIVAFIAYKAFSIAEHFTVAM